VSQPALSGGPGLTRSGLTDSGSDGLVLVERRHRGALGPKGSHPVDNAVTVPVPPASPETPASPAPPRQRPGAGTILTLVNGVLAGVGGVYVSTHSVLITVIATVVAIVLTVMVLIAQW